MLAMRFDLTAIKSCPSHLDNGLRGQVLTLIISYRNAAFGSEWLNSQIPISPFYKRGCQDKCLSGDSKTQGVCRPAPVMKRDSVIFPSPRIHGAVVTPPLGFWRRQAEWLCSANHGSIWGFLPIAFSGCPKGH